MRDVWLLFIYILLLIKANQCYKIYKIQKNDKGMYK